MPKTDVTNLVTTGSIDDGLLCLTKCVCGETFTDWHAILHPEGDCLPFECPKCGRKFYFTMTVRVFQVSEWGK